LISLPGIGVYTASAILCFGFHRDISIVDANVLRVMTRFFGLPENLKVDNDQITDLARRLVPNGKGIEYNEAILDFAALICKKPRPLCSVCPLRIKCVYFSWLSKTEDKIDHIKN
jgi:A/G-specific adenine glycosylase